MEQWIFMAAALGAVIVLPIVGGYGYGKVQQWRGDDVSTSSVGEALASAQGKRMDIQERRDSNGDDTQ